MCNKSNKNEGQVFGWKHKKNKRKSTQNYDLIFRNKMVINVKSTAKLEYIFQSYSMLKNISVKI